MKNSVKKVICLLLCAVFFVTFISGCSSKQVSDKNGDSDPKETTVEKTDTNLEEQPKKLTIGTTIYFMTEFCVLMVEGMQAEAAKQNVELIVLDAKNDPALQLSQVENLITQGVDAIIVSPANSDAIIPAIEMCEKANIPLSAVNMEIATEDPYYYVGPDEVQAGERSAEWLIKNLGEEANICIMQGPIGCSAQIYRDEGIFNVIDNYPGINVLAIKPADWNRAAAVTLMENWIQTYGDEIDAVLVHDDDMALGALQAIQAAGMKDKVKLIACADAIEEACESIVDGGLDVTMFQDVFLEGELSVKMAADLARGNKVEPMFQLIDMIPTEKEGAQDLLDNYYGPRKK